MSIIHIRAKIVAIVILSISSLFSCWSQENAEYCQLEQDCREGQTCDIQAKICIDKLIDNASEDLDAGSDSGTDKLRCVSNADCATPDDLCSQPNGMCNNEGICEYNPVDCSEFDSECTVGVCDNTDGTCRSIHSNEEMACGEEPFITCSPCQYEDDEQCGTEGIATGCYETSNSCQGGACIAKQTTLEDQSCSRPSTEGSVCSGPAIAKACGECTSFSSTCDRSGQRKCDNTEYRCQSNQCQSYIAESTESCERNTTGVLCGTNSNTRSCGNCQGSCGNKTSGTVAGQRSCSCDNKVCNSGGACTVDTVVSCSQSCTISCSPAPSPEPCPPPPASCNFRSEPSNDDGDALSSQLAL